MLLCGCRDVLYSFRFLSPWFLWLHFPLIKTIPVAVVLGSRKVSAVIRMKNVDVVQVNRRVSVARRRSPREGMGAVGAVGVSSGRGR